MAESEKNLDDMTVAELRERASDLEITGRSSMNKEELLQSVKDAEEQTAMMQSDEDSSSSSADTVIESTGESNSEETESSSDEKESGSDESSSEESSEDESGSGTSAEDRPWRDSSSSSDGDGEEDASGTPAPSIGPNTKIDYTPPEERLDKDKISDVDAMGLDKRRQVGGQRYGASPAKQALVYGGALAVIAALVVGGKLLADELDQPPANQEDTAPWSEKTESEQKKPKDIDFPRSTEQ